MATNQKKHKALTGRAKSAIALAVMLVITVAVSCLGIAGMKLDKDGVRVLLPFMPFKKDMKAYTLSLGLSSGMELNCKMLAAEEGQDLQAMANESMAVMKERLKAYGVNDSRMEVKDDAIVVNVPKYNDANMAMIEAVLGGRGVIEFKDQEGNVLLNNSDIASARVKFSNGYSFVEMKTTKEGTDRLKAATEKTMGSTMGIYLDGAKLVEPKVDEVAKKGTMMMSFGYTPEATRAIAAMMENAPLSVTFTEITHGEKANEVTSLYTALMVVFWAVFALACLYMVIKFRMAGLGAAWTLWAYVLCFFFLQATVTLAVVSVGVWVMALAGLVLVAYTSIRQLQGMEKAVAEGRDARSSVRAGFRTSDKMNWLVNGAVLAAALLLMILNVTRPMGYTLATVVVSSVLVGLGLSRWFVPCMVRVAGSKTCAITGKGAKQ